MRAEALRRYWMRRPYTVQTQITAEGQCLNNVKTKNLKKTIEVNSADLKLPRLQTNEFNLDCAGLRKPRLTSANIQTTTFSKSKPATFPSDADQKIPSDSDAAHHVRYEKKKYDVQMRLRRSLHRTQDGRRKETMSVHY